MHVSIFIRFNQIAGLIMLLRTSCNIWLRAARNMLLIGQSFGFSFFSRQDELLIFLLLFVLFAARLELDTTKTAAATTTTTIVIGHTFYSVLFVYVECCQVC